MENLLLLNVSIHREFYNWNPWILIFSCTKITKKYGKIYVSLELENDILNLNIFYRSISINSNLHPFYINITNSIHNVNIKMITYQNFYYILMF